MAETIKRNRTGVIAIIVFFFILIFLGLLTVRLLSGEDDWICENGQWIKHGNPSSPMPIENCPQKAIEKSLESN